MIFLGNKLVYAQGKQPKVGITISTAAQLYQFAKDVNSRKKFSKKTVVLTADIFLNDTTGWQQWSYTAVDKKQWMPIGTTQYPFSGTFDGRGHVIYGMYINKGNDGLLQGLFGVIHHATIMNLSIAASLIKGNQYLGGVVACAVSSKRGDYNVISNCHYSGKIIGERNYIGGIIGGVASQSDRCTQVTSCSNEGTIEGVNYVGGIIGMYNNDVGANVQTGSTSSGRYFDLETPLIHQPNSKKHKKRASGGAIYNCSNRGNVSGWMSVGGIIGWYEAYRWSWQLSPDTLANCYNIGSVIANSAAGAIVGQLRRTQAWDIEDFRRSFIFSNCYNTGTVISSHSQMYAHLLGDATVLFSDSLNSVEGLEKQRYSVWTREGKERGLVTNRLDAKSPDHQMKIALETSHTFKSRAKTPSSGVRRIGTRQFQLDPVEITASFWGSNHYTEFSSADLTKDDMDIWTLLKSIGVEVRGQQSYTGNSSWGPKGPIIYNQQDLCVFINGVRVFYTKLNGLSLNDIEKIRLVSGVKSSIIDILNGIVLLAPETIKYRRMPDAAVLDIWLKPTVDSRPLLQ